MEYSVSSMFRLKLSFKKLIKATPKLRAPFKPIETAIVLGVVLLGTSAILYQKHEQKVHEQLNLTPTSSQSSSTPSTSTTSPLTPSLATTTAPQSSSNSPASNCTQKSVPSTTTTYENTSSLPQGQTEDMGSGFPGLEVICGGKVTKEVPPTPGVVLVGTSPTPTQSQTSPSQGSTSSNNGLTESQAAQQCQDSLAGGAGGGTSVDAEEYIIDCMQQYGY